MVAVGAIDIHEYFNKKLVCVFQTMPTVEIVAPRFCNIVLNQPYLRRKLTVLDWAVCGRGH